MHGRKKRKKNFIIYFCFIRLAFALIASISRGIQYTFIEVLLTKLNIMTIFLLSSIVNVIFFALVAWIGNFDIQIKQIT